MKILIKQRADICLFQNVIRDDYVITNYWPMRALARVVELFEPGNMIDFDDTYFSSESLGGDLCRTQFDFVMDLHAADVISRYEDECYYRGVNFDKFAEFVKGYMESEPVEVEL